MEILRSRYNIQSVLVEGGAGIIQSVLERRLVHQIVLTMRPCYLGGFRCLTDPLPNVANLQAVRVASIGGDIVIYGQMPEYNEYFKSSKNMHPLSEGLKDSALSVPEEFNFEDLRDRAEFLHDD